MLKKKTLRIFKNSMISHIKLPSKTKKTKNRKKTIFSSKLTLALSLIRSSPSPKKRCCRPSMLVSSTTKRWVQTSIKKSFSSILKISTRFPVTAHKPLLVVRGLGLRPSTRVRNYQTFGQIFPKIPHLTSGRTRKSRPCNSCLSWIKRWSPRTKTFWTIWIQKTSTWHQVQS